MSGSRSVEAFEAMLELPDDELKEAARSGVDPGALLDYAVRNCAGPGKLKAILAAGADPNTCVFDDESLLHRAVRYRVPAAIPVLVEAGADPNRGDAAAPGRHIRL